MRVAGNQAVAVTDFNQLAVARHITCLGHHATGSRMDRCAFGCGKIQTLVHGMTARYRLAPPAERGAQVGIIDGTESRQPCLRSDEHTSALQSLMRNP